MSDKDKLLSDELLRVNALRHTLRNIAVIPVIVSCALVIMIFLKNTREKMRRLISVQQFYEDFGKRAYVKQHQIMHTGKTPY